MQVTMFLNRLMQAMPAHHRVFPPLEDSELEAWCAKWPQRFLPEDLLGLLRLTNGIQFWVGEGSPEGYLRLLPLRDSARRTMWGRAGDDIEGDAVPYPHWLAISEHQDGASYLVLDTDQHRYYSMDTCGADLTCPAGNSVEELLEYIWDSWVLALG